MFTYLLPLLIIVGSNVLYNVATKSTPVELNPFASLVVTYIVGAVFSFALYFVTNTDKSFFTELGYVDWTAIVLGFSLVGLEAGYIYLYRTGWNISVASLVANILLAIVLVFIGLAVYKEHISWQQFCGMAFCLVGLLLIWKK